MNFGCPRNWCDKHHAVLEEIFAYGSYSFTATSVAAWRIFSLKVAKINTSYRFTLSTGVEVEMSVRGSVSHPQFVRDYCYNMDSSGCVWVRVLSGTEIILTEAALAKMTLLPLSKDEVAMFCKRDSHENKWDRDKVEKFREWHEPYVTNPKVFDRVFWYEQYDEWKKTGEGKLKRYEELCRQQEKSDVHGYIAWQNWKIFQRKSDDDEPTDEGARAYHKYRKEVWALQNEEAFFKSIMRSLPKATDEERQLAIRVYFKGKDL